MTQAAQDGHEGCRARQRLKIEPFAESQDHTPEQQAGRGCRLAESPATCSPICVACGASTCSPRWPHVLPGQSWPMTHSSSELQGVDHSFEFNQLFPQFCLLAANCCLWPVACISTSKISPQIKPTEHIGSRDHRSWLLVELTPSPSIPRQVTRPSTHRMEALPRARGLAAS